MGLGFGGMVNILRFAAFALRVVYFDEYRFGQIGLDARTVEQTFPVLLSYPFVRIACSERHVVALTLDNLVYTWGRYHFFVVFA